jgi:hypothetical protein
MALSDDIAELEASPRVPGAPDDPMELVAGAAGVTLLQAAKVIAAFHGMDVAVPRVPRVVLTPRRQLGPELEAAIHRKVAELGQLMRLGDLVARGEPLRLPSRLLVRPSHVADMCRGCPEAVTCAVESLSTPSACLTGRHALSTVTVVRATRTHLHVSCKHPEGRYDVPIKSIIENGVS